MSQRELRVQRQKEQDERRLSLHRNNASFTVVSDARECQIIHPVNDPAPAECKRSRSCSPMPPMTQDQLGLQEQGQKKINLPPIYIREKTSSALVNKLAANIGENIAGCH